MLDCSYRRVFPTFSARTKAAKQVQKAQGVRKRLLSFALDDPGPVLWGGERIFRDGECVGYTTSAGYGHTVGGAVALGYVRRPEPVTGYAGFVRARIGEESSGAVSDGEQRLSAAIEDWQGTPYAWGGETRKGLDCSGFVMVAFREAGIQDKTVYAHV